MKNDPTVGRLIGVLSLSALASVILCVLYIQSSRQVRPLQNQVTGITNERMRIGLFVNDLVDYSRTHPAIDPLLESAGIKPPKQGAAAPTNHAPAK